MAATYRPQSFPCCSRRCVSKGFGIDESLMSAEFDLYHGDLVALGKGEIMFRRADRCVNASA